MYSLLVLSAFFLLAPSASAYDGEIPATGVSPSLFIVMGSIMLLFLIAGLSSDVPYFVLGSMVVLFLMGIIVQAGNLYLPTGEEAYIYGWNYTDYHFEDYNGTVPSIHQSETNLNLFHKGKVYAPWDNANSHLVGWLLMVLSTIFFALTLYGLRGDDY